uniref:Uncharacterized protein n=1 Tax=Schizophyllum commune (strain H4-8 / FGSC 9210) TaxID=578458 RepID=D8PYL8_SCHCM
MAGLTPSQFSELFDRTLHAKDAAEAQRDALLHSVVHANTNFAAASAEVAHLRTLLHQANAALTRERADHDDTMREYVVVREKLSKIASGWTSSMSGLGTCCMCDAPAMSYIVPCGHLLCRDGHDYCICDCGSFLAEVGACSNHVAKRRCPSTSCHFLVETIRHYTNPALDLVSSKHFLMTDAEDYCTNTVDYTDSIQEALHRANRQIKRKWTTGIMKSWHGTDPTSTAPNVEYSDPKAAARAAKHKRRKKEAADQKAKGAFAQTTRQKIGVDGTSTLHAKSVSTNQQPFNTGWRRFGPQGQDISGYTPHYPDVPTIHWPTGLISIAPFLPDEGEADVARNKLAWYWGQDPVHGVVGANVHSLREFQDAAIRESNDLHPYVAATLVDFKSWLKTPGKIRCILDLTCGFPQPDRITERIADNLVQSLASDFGHKYGGHFTIVADMMKTQDWFLLHTSGFLSFGHIDASGMATSAQIRGAGLKEWIIFSSTNMPRADVTTTRDERKTRQEVLVRRVADLVSAASTCSLMPQRLSGADESQESHEWEVDGCVLELHPGMKYYQPAATVHAAYTPVPTAAAGKHFFTYDDLHRVEMGRRVQQFRPGVTNHNHNCGVQLMLISLAAALPARAAAGRHYMAKPDDLHKVARERAKPSRKTKESGERAKQRWEDTERKKNENSEREAEYTMTMRLIDEEWADKGTAFDRLAYTVASRILYACKTEYAGDDKPSLPGPEYILDGESWNDPGPVLDVGQFTDDLIYTHVDEIRGIELGEAPRSSKQRRREQKGNPLSEKAANDASRSPDGD